MIKIKVGRSLLNSAPTFKLQLERKMDGVGEARFRLRLLGSTNSSKSSLVTMMLQRAISLFCTHTQLALSK